MKKSLNGLIGTCLLLTAWSLPGRAQEQKPGPRADAQQQAAPAQQPTAPAATPDDQQAPVAAPFTNQQTPPTTPPAQQQTPPTTPPAQQQTPPTTPPAQQQTPPASPAQQPVPPPDAGAQAQQHGRIPEPPPPPPKVPDVRRPGESGYFVGLSVWIPTEQPIFDRGEASTFSGSSRIVLQGKPKYAENVEIGVAAGLHNSVRLSFNESTASGDFTTPIPLVVWGQGYTANTYLSTNYRFLNGKISYEYLTWPYPVGSRKFRLKTLWQMQLTSVSTSFNAPFNYYDSAGNIILDSSGNPINLVGAGTRRVITPTFGLGGHYYYSRHVRFEVNGSGFAVPHHWTIWDTDATVNFRIMGHFELRVGAKAYHFKTSPLADFFVRGTMASAFFGVRWYSNSE